MKTKLTIAVLLLTAMTLYGQYFFDDFTDAQKLDTAHAYLMVSEQYAEIGDKNQSEKYKEMALFIYPELIQTDENTIKAIISPPGKIENEKITGPDRSSMIRYYFSKLLRSITTGDLKSVDSLITERLYLPEFPGGLNKNQLSPMVAELSEKYKLSTYSPGDFYNLETINVVKVEEGTYLLTVEGADNKNLYTSDVTFFGKVQTFRFRQYDTGWKIDNISSIF